MAPEATVSWWPLQNPRQGQKQSQKRPPKKKKQAAATNSKARSKAGGLKTAATKSKTNQ
jgi:hypothetical protein